MLYCCSIVAIKYRPIEQNSTLVLKNARAVRSDKLTPFQWRAQKLSNEKRYIRSFAVVTLEPVDRVVYTCKIEQEAMEYVRV